MFGIWWFLHLLEQASCTNSLLEQIEQTWLTERTHLDLDSSRTRRLHLFF
jgi:hypothetical protein